MAPTPHTELSEATRLRFQMGTLLPAAYHRDKERDQVVSPRFGQPLFTPAACADLFHAMAKGLERRRRADLALASGALARCPEGAPVDQLAEPARALVRSVLDDTWLDEPYALLAVAGVAGLDAEAAERVSQGRRPIDAGAEQGAGGHGAIDAEAQRGRGPLAVAEVELLLDWDATRRAVFAEFVATTEDRYFKGFPPLPDAMERIGDDPAYVAFARTTLEAVDARLADIHAGKIPYRADKAFDRAESATVRRAAAVALRRDEPWLPELLGPLLRKAAVAPTQAKTLPSQGVLFAVAHATEAYPTPEAVVALRTARAATRHAGVPKLLDRMLKRIDAALANRLEVAYRVPDGRVRRQLGEHTAVISTEGEVELSWWHGDKRLKSVPAAVRRDHGDEVKHLRELAKQVKQQQATLVRALEAGFASEVTPPYRALAGQPVADRLIWEFEVSPGQWRAELGLGVPDVPVRLWHPARASVDEVHAWREVVHDKELRQPFKQAFREVYLLTPAEEAAGFDSARFAGHVVDYHRLYALFKQRGWQAGYLGQWDGGYDGEAQRVMAGGRWRASFFHDLVEEGYASTDRVHFHRRTGDGWRPVRLAEVPPLVFSEAMRDVDLFVAVTSVATDPEWLDRGAAGLHGYWRAASVAELGPTAQVRHDALARLLPRLTVAARCTLTERFLVVRGDLRTYKIHLGSGNILMEPNDAYLCIVVGPGHRGQVFLPFEEDGMLSVILSKAFLLAADSAITDPTITRQIRG